MKALYLPGPAYHDRQVKVHAGWWHILEYQRQAIEQAGYEVIVPEIPAEYIDNTSSFSQIASYSLGALSIGEKEVVDLVVGAPSFAHHTIIRIAGSIPIVTYVWNQADWFRDQQLISEYKKFDAEYRTLPINTIMNELSLKLSTRVIANSHYTKSTHAKIVPESKIGVASWGVDSERFHPAETREGFKVLFFGSDMVRKGFTYLWNALRLCRESLGDFEFWVLGCNPFKDELPPNIRMFGLVPNTQVPEIIRQCHVMVLPTLEDGMPLAVQECMASGVVPITTECAAEAFSDGIYGASGFIIPYRDSGAIVKHLRLLKDNPDLLNAMSKAARRAAETQTWESFKWSFASIIKEVTNAPT